MKTLDIQLGGRSYPLTLSPDEVTTVQAAAEAVEAQIGQLKSQYAISDRIDLMAMAALQIAVQAQSVNPETTANQQAGGASRDWPKEQVDDLLRRIQKALDT